MGCLGCAAIGERRSVTTFLAFGVATGVDATGRRVASLTD